MNTWNLLVDLTLKGTLVLTLGWCAAFALRRRSAAARHIVWTAVFAALLALPLLSLGLPAWHHPLANAILPDANGLTFRAIATGTAAHGSTALANLSASASAPAAFDTHDPHGPPDPRDPRGALAIAWTAGAALALLHMLFAYVAIWRLRRAARPSSLDVGALGIQKGVVLLETAHCMPMTAGILHPAIFLPAEAAWWNPDRLRLVLLHELAHILRGDAATQLLARTALCLQWFNPLAWLAWREFIKERERAADDLVLATGARASDYAGHLLDVAHTLYAAPAGAAGVAMARRSQLEGRLMAILDSRIPRTNPGRATLAIALLTALAVTVPLATVHAQSPAERQAPADLDAAIRAAAVQKNHDMLDETAVTLEKLRRYDDAQRVREAALAIRKESGDSSPNYAEGLVKLGDLARRRNAYPAAIEYYTRAVALGDMQETVPALIELGLDAASKHNAAAAQDYLQRARNAARAGNLVGRAMTWLAFVDQADPDKAAEVESLYRTAISIEDIGTAEQAMTTEFLVRFLRSHDRGDEATPLEERAREMRKALAAALSVPLSGSYASAMKVGPGVTAPKLIFKLEPEYTEEARATKFSGTVLLKVVIDVDGTAKEVTVVQSLGMGLDEKAVDAVSRWKFQPGMKAGVPVPVIAQIQVNFRLM